ncbi:MAG: hypothetical protein RI949_2402 [Pseudomonadota bacterium]|jgi:putative FmdB family regulatory protein
MPIYAYRCGACGLDRDVLQKFSDPVLTVCPECGAQAFSKQLTAAGFQLKGSGWYVTDFRDAGGKAKSADGSESSKGAKGGAASEGADASKSTSQAPAASSESSTPAAASSAAAPASTPAAPAAAKADA